MIEGCIFADHWTSFFLCNTFQNELFSEGYQHPFSIELFWLLLSVVRVVVWSSWFRALLVTSCCSPLVLLTFCSTAWANMLATKNQDIPPCLWIRGVIVSTDGNPRKAAGCWIRRIVIVMAG
jgi:hypothetical protein